MGLEVLQTLQGLKYTPSRLKCVKYVSRYQNLALKKACFKIFKDTRHNFKGSMQDQNHLAHGRGPRAAQLSFLQCLAEAGCCSEPA